MTSSGDCYSHLGTFSSNPLLVVTKTITLKMLVCHFPSDFWNCCIPANKSLRCDLLFVNTQRRVHRLVPRQGSQHRTRFKDCEGCADACSGSHANHQRGCRPKPYRYAGHRVLGKDYLPYCETAWKGTGMRSSTVRGLKQVWNQHLNAHFGKITVQSSRSGFRIESMRTLHALRFSVYNLVGVIPDMKRIESLVDLASLMPFASVPHNTHRALKCNVMHAKVLWQVTPLVSTWRRSSGG